MEYSQIWHDSIQISLESSEVLIYWARIVKFD